MYWRSQGYNPIGEAVSQIFCKEVRSSLRNMVSSTSSPLNMSSFFLMFVSLPTRVTWKAAFGNLLSLRRKQSASLCPFQIWNCWFPLFEPSRGPDSTIAISYLSLPTHDLFSEKNLVRYVLQGLTFHPLPSAFSAIVSQLLRRTLRGRAQVITITPTLLFRPLNFWLAISPIEFRPRIYTSQGLIRIIKSSVFFRDF